MGQGELFKDVESMDFSSGITHTCNECGEIKPIKLFAKQWSRVDGTRSYSNKCKPCIKKQRKIKEQLKEKHPYPTDPNYECEMCGRTSKDLKKQNINSHTSRNICKDMFVLDHNHKTGEFNSYICHTCNSKVSWNMGEDIIETSEQQTKYVRKYYG